MKLSTNFTLAEFTKSQTALRLGIANTMPREHKDNAILLAKHVLQPVREHFGITVINSGYRSKQLNKAIGGSNTSQHCSGEAADIEIPGVSNLDVAKWISENLEFDQLILEFYSDSDPAAGWVHVSYTSNNNRNQVLTAESVNGKQFTRQD